VPGPSWIESSSLSVKRSNVGREDKGATTAAPVAPVITAAGAGTAPGAGAE
jgi:hypothetical protein